MMSSPPPSLGFSHFFAEASEIDLDVVTLSLGIRLVYFSEVPELAEPDSEIILIGADLKLGQNPDTKAGI